MSRVLFFFFFSSRRRHTRSLCDWSQTCALPIYISEFAEKRVNAGAKYVSQFGPGWRNYKPSLSEAELKQLKESVRSAMRMKDGKPVEGFRYYKEIGRASCRERV